MRWTKEEDEKLKKLYYDNYKIQDIANELGKTKNQVRGRKRKFGYTDRNRKEAYRAHLPNSLNETEEQIIYGSLLGDGSITLQKKTEYNFRGVHSAKQLTYMQWKKKLLKRWDPKIYFTSNNETICLYTPYHSIWKKINQKSYIDGRKTINQDWLEKIDYLGLSCLIGDDGTRHGNGCRIATNNFNKKEHKMMTEVFSDAFNVNFKIHYKPSVDYYSLFIPAEDYRELCEKLPVPNGMEYKFLNEYE
jgi:transposase